MPGITPKDASPGSSHSATRRSEGTLPGARNAAAPSRGPGARAARGPVCRRFRRHRAHAISGPARRRPCRAPGHAAGVGHGLPQGTIGLQPQLQRVVETVAQQRRRAAQAALEPAASVPLMGDAGLYLPHTPLPTTLLDSTKSGRSVDRPSSSAQAGCSTRLAAPTATARQAAKRGDSRGHHGTTSLTRGAGSDDRRNASKPWLYSCCVDPGACAPASRGDFDTRARPRSAAAHPQSSLAASELCHTSASP